MVNSDLPWEGMKVLARVDALQKAGARFDAGADAARRRNLQARGQAFL
jgi:hypothetical protein